MTAEEEVTNGTFSAASEGRKAPMIKKLALSVLVDRRDAECAEKSIVRLLSREALASIDKNPALWVDNDGL